MALIENENSLTIVGRPAIANYAILAGLIVLIPITAFGMWRSGEVSAIFIILFVIGFGLAAPFILNDLIKPTLRKAVFDRDSRKISIVMGGLLASSQQDKAFHDLHHIELRLTIGAAESPTGGRRYHHAIVFFDDGTELIAVSQNIKSRALSEHAQLVAFLAGSGVEIETREIAVPWIERKLKST